MSYIVEPVFTLPGIRSSAGIAAPNGSPGAYRLTFVLAVPGRAVVQDEVNFAKLVRNGDSLLEVASESESCA